MKTNKKSLLVHNDTKNNQTTAIIVDEKDVLKKTKEFLKNISKQYSPLGVILSTTDEKDGFTVAYEKDKFVIVAPNGTTSSAKLYGNWDEALACAQRILNEQGSSQKKNRFVLAQYVQNNQ